ncbi:MAG: PKD domain-containing protein, partial [Gammaproteobacteria bacterium]|nr:PKD domain-containing protein [Gammaproteobacteria bacterium]
FRLDLTAAGELTVYSEGSMDTYGYLYDENGDRLASNDDGGTSTNFSYNYTVHSAGTFYVKVRAYSDTRTGGYTVVNTFAETSTTVDSETVLDDYGNDRSTAGVLAVNSSLAGSIETGGDVDYHRLDLAAAGELTVYSEGSMDTYGYLYDEDGDQLASNDDGGSSTNFSYSYSIPAGGTYYIQIRAYSSTRTGSYTLVNNFEMVSDDYGNDLSSAGTLSVNSSVTGSIEVGGDSDYFRIELEAEGELTVYSESNLDTFGYLYDANGEHLTTDNDGGSNANFSYSYAIPSAGSYYVQILASSETTTGSYTVINQFEEVATDDYGNDQASAALISENGDLSGVIEAGGDNDYFRLELGAAGELTVSTTGSMDTYGYLYDESGGRLASNDDGGVGTNFSYTYSIPAAGSYYVRVRAYSSTAIGGYQLNSSFVVLQPPVANMSLSVTEGFVPLTVAVDGSGSTDTDGLISHYLWTLSDGRTATGPTADFLFTQDGTFTITLLVTDATGLTDTTSQSVLVQYGQPIADFSLSPTEGSVPLTVEVDGAASTAGGGSVAEEDSWATGRYSNSENRSQLLTIPGASSLTVTVVGETERSFDYFYVYDSNGTQLQRYHGSISDTFTVAGDSITARLTSDSSVTRNGVTITVQGDGANGISSYSWSSSDGQMATGQSASLLFESAGTYDVTLTVIDSNGQSNSLTQQVTTTYDPPIAQFTMSPESGATPLTVQLDGSASHEAGSAGTASSSASWNTGPYTNNESRQEILSVSGASEMVVTLVGETEAFYDYIKIYDGSGSLVQQFTGVMNESVTVSGDTITAELVSDHSVTREGVVVTASSASGNGITSYQWSSTGGHQASGRTAEMTFSTAGRFDISLTVSDGVGSTTTTSEVLVESLNDDIDPTASITSIDKSTGKVTLQISDNLGINYSELISMTIDGAAVGTSYDCLSSDSAGRCTDTAPRITVLSGLDDGMELSIVVNVVDLASNTALYTFSGVVGNNLQVSDTLTVQVGGEGGIGVNTGFISSYSSSDETVATVNDAGLVTGVAVGTTTVVVSDVFGNSFSVTVTVLAESATYYNATARLAPQVIAAGISPTIVDLGDTTLDVIAMVRPGILALDRVSFRVSNSGFAIEMKDAGILKNGDEIYKMTYTFARGAFGTYTMTNAWGNGEGQFNIIAYDIGQQQSHQFPELQFGNFPAQQASVRSEVAIDYIGTKRLAPQIVMAGFTPSQIDFADTRFDVIAVVRSGALPIDTVSLSQNQGGFAMAMNEAGVLNNGDRVFSMTYTFQRGVFGTATLDALWGDAPSQFNLRVTDTAQQQSHNFPDVIFGNYPELSQ